MDTLLHADIFFVISSIGFVIFFILLAVILVSLLRLVKKVEKITDKVEAKIDALGDEAENLLADLEESFIFRLLFRSGRTRKSSKARTSRKKE